MLPLDTDSSTNSKANMQECRQNGSTNMDQVILCLLCVVYMDESWDLDKPSEPGRADGLQPPGPFDSLFSSLESGYTS